MMKDEVYLLEFHLLSRTHRFFPMDRFCCGELNAGLAAWGEPELLGCERECY